MIDDLAAETTDPLYADQRNFYKVELWNGDGRDMARILYAGDRITIAAAAFDVAVKHRPRGRYTLRQRARVLRKWPDES